MEAYLLYKCKHLCMLKFCVVCRLKVKKYIACPSKL